MIRQPAVAGRFYPADPEKLIHDLDRFLVASAERTRALGCVVPHAGYLYSGHVAGAVFARMQPVERYIILCPNHTGLGESLAIMSSGAWQTPLGDVPADPELAAELKKACHLLAEDEAAHRLEHSLEVQLPFLQRLHRQFHFVPIAVGVSRFAPLEALGEAIGRVLAASKVPTVVVASSDMNHYESDSVTRVKDRKALDQILALNPRGLYDTVRSEGITMCGYGPATVMLTAACHLGATTAELVRYATSGDVTGERDEVVGYAGVVVS
ncbi:MAG TPA: AmmeMemoRadiSam system protein B [Candidatus Acidoferrales bacterium]